MPRHRAILIQDIREYSEYIKPFLNEFLASNKNLKLTEDSLLLWIISEQLERIYYLFTDTHRRRAQPHEHVYYQVINGLANQRQMNLETLTSFYIKAPRLYSDNSIIEITLSGRTLTIKYTSDITLT